MAMKSMGTRVPTVALLALFVQLACASSDPPTPGLGSAGSTAGSSGAPAAGESSSSGGSGGGSTSAGTGGVTPLGSGGYLLSGGSGGSAAASGGVAGSAGGGGASAGSAGSGCAGEQYKLCDGFEDGQVGSMPTGWAEFKGYEAGSPTDVVLASDEFHRGKMSLKSSSGTRGATRAQKDLTQLGVTAYRHWGRIFYKVDDPAPRPSSGVIHITFVSLDGPGGENRIVDIVENTSGAHQWLFNVPDDSCCGGSDYDWTFDTEWHCAEWYVDTTTRSYQFFQDSEQVQDISFMNRNSAPMSEYEAIVVGETYYQPSNIISSPFTIWFDDLAIDDNRIGCE